MKQIFQESWAVAKYEMIAVGILALILIVVMFSGFRQLDAIRNAPCEEFANRTLQSLPVRCIDYYFGDR